MRTACILVLTLAVATPLAAQTSASGVAAERISDADRQARIAERDRLWGRVEELTKAKKGAEAIAVAEVMLALEQAIFGETHEEVAITLDILGGLHRDLGNLARAQPYYEQSLAIARVLRGENHPDTAARLAQLGRIHRDKDEYEQALPLYEQSLAVYRKVRGEEHRDTAIALSNLAGLVRLLGDSDRALALYEQSLIVYRKVFGEEDPGTATILGRLARLYHDQGDLVRARPLYERSLAISRKVRGEDHVETATHLANLGLLYRDQGDYTSAAPLYEQSLAIFRRVLGEEHPETATCLSNVALLYRDQGDYGRARVLLERSLAIRRKALGDYHRDTATALGELAEIFRRQGDYVGARSLYEQSATILRKVQGETHPDTATALNNLALLYENQGDYSRARPLFEQGLAIYRKARGENDRDTATLLHNLAENFRYEGDYVRAQPLAEQSVAIRRKLQGDDHPETAIGLRNLAGVFFGQREFARARALYEQSLSILSKSLGQDHPSTAMSLNNLAEFYGTQGDYVRALALFERGLAIRRKALGEAHLDTADSLNGLARIYHAQGDFVRARSLYEQSLAITQTRLALAASAQSERQQLLMAASLRNRLDGYVSLVAPGVGDIGAAWSAAAAWKGAALARRRAYARVARDPGVQDTFAELQRITQQLQVQAFQTPAPDRAEAWRRQVAELSTRKEALESQLSARSTAFRRAQRPAAEVLAQVLPAGTALVDFLEYSHFTPTAAGLTTYERRLAAFLVQAGRPTRLLALGPVASVEAALTPWRAAVTAGVEPPANIAATLRRTVWDPVEAVLREGQATQVVLSPDGVLNQLAFAALPGRAPGTYVLDDWPLAVVPSAQVLVDLLDDDQPTPATGNLLALGDVDYDRQDSGTAPRAPRTFPSARAPREDEATFARLLGTRGELASLERLYRTAFGDAGLSTLADAGATEAAVREKLPHYRYLHLATHGFFAPPRVASALARSTETPQLGETSNGQSLAGYHPGLLSGLALAGANAPTADDDGILTAEEVATLDLSAVELAVLSACETGLGRVAGGEGVLGLQRAFHAAGARTVVASLWKVDDTATRDLMERFYDNVWNKAMGKLAALHEAQRWMLRSRGARGLTPPAGAPPGDRLPPYYWAAFVLSGDWR